MDKRKILFKDNEGYFVKDFELYIHKKNDIEAPLKIDLPNIPAMYLNISDRAKENAREIYKNKLEPFISINENENENYFEFSTEKSEEHLFDFFENLFISIIFMYTAVESITNNLIPNDYLETRVINKTSHAVGKKYIEKKDPLDYKIKKLIPKIYNYNFETNNVKFWSNFKELEDIRNELIHSKSEELVGDEHSIGPTLSKIFFRIVKFNIIESGREVIEYLITKTNNLTGMPFEFHKGPIDFIQYRKHFTKKN